MRKLYYLLFFSLLCILFASNIMAQITTDIYMIGSSTHISGETKGVSNGFNKLNNSHIYIIGSDSKDYEMWLDHSTSNNITGDNSIKQSISNPISQLNQYNAIDIDEFIQTKSRAEVWQWMLENSEKKIWVIDRNDFYKSSSAFSEPDMMKLIETRIWLDNIPDEVLNPLNMD